MNSTSQRSIANTPTLSRIAASSGLLEFRGERHVELAANGHAGSAVDIHALDSKRLRNHFSHGTHPFPEV